MWEYLNLGFLQLEWEPHGLGLLAKVVRTTGLTVSLTGVGEKKTFSGFSQIVLEPLLLGFLASVCTTGVKVCSNYIRLVWHI